MADWGHFFWQRKDKNYAVRAKFIWFDLPIKLHIKKRGFQCLNSPMVWVPLLTSHLLCRFWHLRADRTRSLAFSYCLFSNKHDLSHRGFPSTFQQNFPSLSVCNTWKREQSRKMAINFPPDGRLGPVFFVAMKTTRTIPWQPNLIDLTFL